MREIATRDRFERGHTRDLDDVRAMLVRGLVTPDGLRSAFDAAADRLYRYPAVDPDSYRRALESMLAP